VKLRPQPTFQILCLFLLLSLLIIPSLSQAQETEENSPENMTDENIPISSELPPPVSDNQDIANEITPSSSNDENDDEDVDIVDENTDATHKIHFELQTRVEFAEKVVSDLFTGFEPYMAIEYTNEFEVEVDLQTPGRKVTDVESRYEAQPRGELAKNEFFECRLEITMPETPMTLTTTHKINENPETNETHESLALKILPQITLKEDWLSRCEMGGFELNSQGNPEEYNQKALKMIQPALDGMMFEDIDLKEDVDIPLVLEAQTILDEDLMNEITFSGEGKITIELLK